MTIERQDELAREVLAPLDRVEPVRLVSGDRGRRQAARRDDEGDGEGE